MFTLLDKYLCDACGRIVPYGQMEFKHVPRIEMSINGPVRKGGTIVRVCHECQSTGRIPVSVFNDHVGWQVTESR